jgi:hypothetical protein
VLVDAVFDGVVADGSTELVLAGLMDLFEA